MITLGFCSPGQVETEFMASVVASYAYDRDQPDPILDPLPVVTMGGPRLHVLRDAMIREWLNHKDTDWFMSIDTDHSFSADAIRQLHASADRLRRPIVGGLCFGSGRTGGPLIPTIYVNNDQGIPEAVYDFPPNKLVECHATGWAFLLVHRSVMTRMYEVYGDPQPWFVDGQVGIDGPVLECDLQWCLRAQALGFPIHVNTSVEAPHKKPTWLNHAFFRHTLAQQETADG